MPRQEVEEFFSRMATVVDPLTKLAPRREVELTAVFAFRQARQIINWASTAPRFVSTPLTAPPLHDLLSQPGLVLTEYPLFAASGQQTNRWGEMRADAMFVSTDLRHKVMFEAKVDSYFTYGDRPPDAQLSRQLEYLAALDGETKTLVLLCPNFNVGWYWERLSWAWNALCDRDRVFACLTSWEAVLGPNAS